MEYLGHSAATALARQLAASINKIKASTEQRTDLQMALSRYITSTYQNHQYLRTVVLQNQQCRLMDLYTPLTLKHGPTNKKICVDHLPSEVLYRNGKTLITDSAGMGKSTLLKYLLLKVYELGDKLPLFVELRRLGGDQTITQWFAKELTRLSDKPIDSKMLADLLAEARPVVFLDGYDEVPSEQRVDISNGIRAFCDKGAYDWIVLTSRPEESLASFADFEGYEVCALNREEAFDLIRKYDSNGEKSRQLINRLESEDLHGVNEFLGNPLLASLLYKSFSYKPTIPFKKNSFYRQVFDSLFDAHDLSKEGAYHREKDSGLDIDDFHRLLRALAILCARSQKIEFDKDSLLSQIATARKLAGLETEPPRVFRRLVGLSQAASA